MTRSSVTVLESFRGPRAGSHRLVFTHTLAGTRHERDTTSPVSHTERIELEFSVDAPRLGLARPNDVRSVYPAAGARTDHTKTLPHIVLQTRSFPWAREVSPGLVQDLPWVALLVLRGEELAQVQFRELSGAELAAGNPGTWSPHAAAAPDLALTAREREASVQVMELPEALLRSIAPARRDLGLLAHIRRVSLLAKADGESAETASARPSVTAAVASSWVSKPSSFSGSSPLSSQAWDLAGPSSSCWVVPFWTARVIPQAVAGSRVLPAGVAHWMPAV